MGDLMELPIEDEDRLSDPPLVDLFREEPDRYVVTLLPSDDVSTEPSVSEVINKQSPEGRRIAILLGRIRDLCGAPLTLASHLGGGDYTLHLADGRVTNITDASDNEAVELFERLKQIAVDAELSYRITQSHAQRGRRAG